jgi:phosphatidylserine synthase 2
MRTVRYFRAKKFNWLGLSQQPSLSAKVRRAAGQFLPWSYEDFDWQLTSGAWCA